MSDANDRSMKEVDAMDGTEIEKLSQLVEVYSSIYYHGATMLLSFPSSSCSFLFSYSVVLCDSLMALRLIVEVDPDPDPV